MSLPKRDGVNGRDYLPHKPDTAPGVPAHADQCIQEIIRREAPDDSVIGSVMAHIEQYFGGYTRFLHDDSCPLICYASGRIARDGRGATEEDEEEG